MTDIEQCRREEVRPVGLGRSPRWSLDGRVALVTGASRGLGLEAVTAFATAGADVAVTSRDASTCEAVAAERGTARAGRLCRSLPRRTLGRHRRAGRSGL